MNEQINNIKIENNQKSILKVIFFKVNKNIHSILTLITFHITNNITLHYCKKIISIGTFKIG